MKKILIGFSNTAGLSSRYKKAFEELGYVADFYSFSRHPFGYPTDKMLNNFNNKLLNYISRTIYTLIFIIKYDYFILISGDHLFSNFFDLKLFRFFGKKTMVVFTGCDIQQPEFIKANKNIIYSACNNCSEEYMRFVQCEPIKKIVRTRLIEKYFDVILCHFMNSDSLIRESHHVFVPVDIKALSKYFNTSENEIPVILHAPSNAQYKGTTYLETAIEKLKNEGYVFEFRLIQNIPIQQLYEEIGKSDLVVDQLIQGWYGLLPVEAMAINKPVICFMREELLLKLANDCPIINANPDTIYNVLKFCLDNKGYLIERGNAGRKYVEQFHNSKDIAESLISYFEGVK